MSKHFQNPVATILRARGYIPLPRLWVKSADMPQIHSIANQYKDEVNGVRADVANGAIPNDLIESNTSPASVDPRTDKDAAWEAMERLRAGA